MMSSKAYKLEFYVPQADAEQVKAALFAAGAGRIGNYDSCCWSTSGCGQFRPLENSSPAIGEHGKIERVNETKIELVCSAELIDEVISALKKSHPYETPAYSYWQINF